MVLVLDPIFLVLDRMVLILDRMVLILLHRDDEVLTLKFHKLVMVGSEKRWTLHEPVSYCCAECVLTL